MISFSNKNWYLLVLIIAPLTGCTPPTSPSDTQEPIILEQNTIVLKKSHILSVQTELYQPSFRISGLIVPSDDKSITAPIAGTLTLNATLGQTVKKGETLAHLLPITPFTTKQSTTPKPLVPIKAPFAGTIYQIHKKTNAHAKKGDPLFGIMSDSSHKFVALVPFYLQKEIKIGQAVHFTTNTPLLPTEIVTQNTPTAKNPNQKAIGGQVFDFSDNPTQKKHEPTPKHLLTAQINTPITLAISQAKGVNADAHILGDELKLGVLVPFQAIVGTVKSLESPPHKPTLPLLAHIWVIHQDGTLHKSAVSVIEYRPERQRYLVSGISHDSLIVIGNLSDEWDGKSVKIQ